MVKLDIHNGIVELAHGAGGLASARLTRQLFMPALGNGELAKADDGAVLDLPAGRVVAATDSHVVSPLFFPGGDIGALSVHGSINDVAVMGARPLHLTAAFIIEEGFPLRDLARIAGSMGEAARACGVTIAAADTKVVKRGEADGLYITTTCLGVIEGGIELAVERIRPGDAVLVSGPVGDHGAAVLAARESLGLEGGIESDSAAVHGLTAAMLASGAGLRFLRDPTRGGLATVLCEAAEGAGLGIEIDEGAVPVREPVRAVAELLGLDPLYFACEGRLVAVCAAADVEGLLRAMRAHPQGREATIIGEVAEGAPQLVAKSPWGGKRIVPMLTGDQLPRIC